MGTIASQITSLPIVYSVVYSDADQRKHQSYASLAFVRGIHRGPVNYPHKWPVTRKMFPFDDVIMTTHAAYRPHDPRIYNPTKTHLKNSPSVVKHPRSFDSYAWHCCFFCVKLSFLWHLGVHINDKTSMHVAILIFNPNAMLGLLLTTCLSWKWAYTVE